MSQLRLLPAEFEITLGEKLDASLWRGSFNGRESSLHQLSPFVGKLKSGMVRVLITLFSSPGDVLLDPFCGSGVVPFEGSILGRRVIGNDLSIYAYVLTRGKLSAPASLEDALSRAKRLCDRVEALLRQAQDERDWDITMDLTTVPEWVAQFFHPDTLREVLMAFRILREEQDFFLTSCLLGILHHVRPGFLSYPASHLTPYLRSAKYPKESCPEMYRYRDLRSRLLAKVQRSYRRTYLPPWWGSHDYVVLMQNAMSLSLDSESVDTIISSPPYYGALDYGRDNRLRLWFLGVEDWKELDKALTSNGQVYLPQMRECVKKCSVFSGLVATACWCLAM